MYPFSDGRGETLLRAGRPCSGGDELAAAAPLRVLRLTAPPMGPGPADSEGDELAGPGSAPDAFPPEAAPPAEDKGRQVT